MQLLPGRVSVWFVEFGLAREVAKIDDVNIRAIGVFIETEGGFGFATEWVI